MLKPNKMAGLTLLPETFVKAANNFYTPLYLYDEQVIVEHCKLILSMPNAFGMVARYAMKANSNRALLQLIVKQGMAIDASSFNEVKRAVMAGIEPAKIMLTTQEVYIDDDLAELKELMLQGLKFNVCSFLQLKQIAKFVAEHKINLSMRVHPGVGSGESVTRNTGDKYSCFGIHLSDLPTVLNFAKNKSIVIEQVHVHIGSGGDPQKWQENIDLELEFVSKYFPHATKVSFGGGFKEARMPNEQAANLQKLGEYAKLRIEQFYKKTGRKLIMEMEPGTYVVANSGYLLTRVMDKKWTGKDGFEFILVNGGMEANTRPLLYGSKHPFYLIDRQANLLSDEFNLSISKNIQERIVVGRCCESGDSQTLNEVGEIIPRLMADPKIGDYLVIGGVGAYVSSMSPFNYNSHTQIPELLARTNGDLQLIRKPQTLQQMTCNEISLDKGK